MSAEPDLSIVAAIVLAAGEGRRFGGAKQLHEVDGRPMVEHVLAAVAASGIRTRRLVLGARAAAVASAIDAHGAEVVISRRWAQGQAASLRDGLATLPAAVTEALVVLGDGPYLDPRAIQRVSAGSGVRAADYGHGRSHPVVLPRAVWDRLPQRGETPGRTLEATLIDCRDLPEPGDVDYAPE